MSDLYHFMSSSPSLKIDRVTTTTKGDIADIGFRGDMDGIDCKTATNKKYTFE